MPKITHVKRAQARYATKPVLDAEGKPFTRPVLRKDGSPKSTKSGRAVVQRVTEPDKTKPKPNYTCGKCGKEIKVGDPYKWMKIKTGTYSSTRLVRCTACPNWHEWEYRSTRGANAARIQYEYGNQIDEAEGDDIKAIMEEAAGEIRSLAEEAEEAANNIVDGFGHETSQSEEIQGQADELNSWADSCEEWELDEYDEDEDLSEEEQEEAKEQWLDDQRSSAHDVLDDSPI